MIRESHCTFSSPQNGRRALYRTDFTIELFVLSVSSVTYELIISIFGREVQTKRVRIQRREQSNSIDNHFQIFYDYQNYSFNTDGINVSDGCRKWRQTQISGGESSGADLTKTIIYRIREMTTLMIQLGVIDDVGSKTKRFKRKLTSNIIRFIRKKRDKLSHQKNLTKK